MARPKKVIVSENKLVDETKPVAQEVVKPIDQPVEVPAPEPTPVVAVVRSEAYKAMEALIEQYRKTSRPAKFARKLPELLEKLNSL